MPDWKATAGKVWGCHVVCLCVSITPEGVGAALYLSLVKVTILLACSLVPCCYYFKHHRCMHADVGFSRKLGFVCVVHGSA